MRREKKKEREGEKKEENLENVIIRWNRVFPPDTRELASRAIKTLRIFHKGRGGTWSYRSVQAVTVN